MGDRRPDNQSNKGIEMSKENCMTEEERRLARNKAAREWYAKNKEKHKKRVKRWQKKNRKKYYEYQAEYYQKRMEEPEYLEMCRARARERYRKRSEDDPEFKKKLREEFMERYRSDPAFKKRVLRNSRNYYQRKKQQQELAKSEQGE